MSSKCPRLPPPLPALILLPVIMVASAHLTHSMQTLHAQTTLYLGTAGWVIPKLHTHHVPAPGSHLERYATALNCVEINSTFYRPHQPKTFARWAAVTPPNFRFALKAPKAITHEAKLSRSGAALAAFFDNIRPLAEKLGPILFQLPPKLAFDPATAHEFFTTVRELHSANLVLEPRHASWFTPAVDRLLRDFDVARAMADPPAGSPLAAHPAGATHLRYFRLHGSPIKYRSSYTEDFLQTLTTRITSTPSAETWVIFDNTAHNHAFANALTLRNLLHA